MDFHVRKKENEDREAKRNKEEEARQEEIYQQSSGECEPIDASKNQGEAIPDTGKNQWWLKIFENFRSCSGV